MRNLMYEKIFIGVFVDITIYKLIENCIFNK